MNLFVVPELKLNRVQCQSEVIRDHQLVLGMGMAWLMIYDQIEMKNSTVVMILPLTSRSGQKVKIGHIFKIYMLIIRFSGLILYGDSKCAFFVV